MSARAQGLIAINVTALLAGTAALFGKLALSPFAIVGFRGLFAALALLIWAYAGPACRLGSVAGEAWPPLLASGVVLAAHWLSFFAVVQLGGVAVATLTFATFPLFTVCFEAWRQRRAPHLMELIAAATIILAVWLLVGPSNGSTRTFAVLMGIGSAAGYAAFWHLSSALTARLPVVTICFYQSIIVALLALACVAVSGTGPHELAQWVLLGWLGVANTALAPLLYLYALRRLSASTCSGFIALEPVYAIVLAAMFFHEPISGWTVLSGLLILSASYALLRFETATPNTL